METKKSFSADLVRKRSLFFQMGHFISLGLVLAAFEWNQEMKPGRTKYRSGISKTDVIDVPAPLVHVSNVKMIPPVLPVILKIMPDNTQITDDFTINDKTTSQEIAAFRISVPEISEDPVEDPFINPEFPPDFQGEGLLGFRKWVQEHLTYPPEAIELNL